jgi:hypothetical protein
MTALRKRGHSTFPAATGRARLPPSRRARAPLRRDGGLPSRFGGPHEKTRRLAGRLALPTTGRRKSRMSPFSASTRNPKEV